MEDADQRGIKLEIVFILFIRIEIRAIRVP